MSEKQQTQLKLRHCSFCSKNQTQVRKLLVLEKVAICNECVEICMRALLELEVFSKDSTAAKILEDIEARQAAAVLSRQLKREIALSEAKLDGIREITDALDSVMGVENDTSKLIEFKQ